MPLCNRPWCIVKVVKSSVTDASRDIVAAQCHFYNDVSASEKNPIGSIMQILEPALLRPPIDSADRPSFIPTDK